MQINNATVALTCARMSAESARRHRATPSCSMTDPFARACLGVCRTVSGISSFNVGRATGETMFCRAPGGNGHDPLSFFWWRGSR